MDPYINPDAVTALAYSQESTMYGPVIDYSPVIDYPATGPQPTSFPQATTKAAAAFLTATIGAAVAIFFLFHHHKEPTTQAVALPPTPPTVTVTVTPQTADSTQTPDQLYITLYAQATSRTLDKPGQAAAAISLGHAQCDYLSLNNTPGDAALALMRQYDILTRQQAYGIVEAAITAYCSEYTAKLH